MLTNSGMQKGLLLGCITHEIKRQNLFFIDGALDFNDRTGRILVKVRGAKGEVFGQDWVEMQDIAAIDPESGELASALN